MQKKHHTGQRNGKTFWALVLGAVVIVLAFIGFIGPKMLHVADLQSSPTLESISVDQVSVGDSFSQSESETSFANVPMAPPPADDVAARAPASATVEGIVSSNEIVGGKDNKSLLAELVDEDGLAEGDYLRSQPTIQADMGENYSNRQLAASDPETSETIAIETPKREEAENLVILGVRLQEEFREHQDNNQVAQGIEHQSELAQVASTADSGQGQTSSASSISKRSESGRREDSRRDSIFAHMNPNQYQLNANAVLN